MNDPPDKPNDHEPLARRLDPDQAAATRGPAPKIEPVIDTRKYRWAIGILGLTIVLILSIIQLANNGISGGAGIAAGHRLHFFAAPLANTSLNGDANLKPTCTFAKHDPRALNICLISHREPMVLAFFVTDSGDCLHAVDALQTVSRQFRSDQVQFAAVGVRASHGDTEALVRSHRWTIPVAYDADGAVGAVYGVEICPMIELAYRGGVVKDRLIGNHWLTRAALAARVKALVG